MQRNHKIFTVEMLQTLVNKQQQEIRIISSFLRKKPTQVLDIGCGLGIYDLALHDFYKNNIKFHLLDKTTTEEEEKKLYYGYNKKGAFYNNLNYTKEFLMLNGIDEKNINCIIVNDDNNVTNKYLQDNLSNVDLIISIISWGFHYPVETYIDTVHKILSDDGLLCFHCRDIDNNLPILSSKFEILHPIKINIVEGSLLICKKKNN